MKTHNLIQGSPEWHAYRTSVWNASDAPAMMGCSPYKRRDQLLQELATGVVEEVTPEQQRRFDDGHRFEALARPLAEKIIGDELYPVTGSSDLVIAGRALSASFDGLTMLETVGFEHKSLNNDLRAAFDDIETVAPEHREITGCRLLPMHYRVQMEQQMLVSGADRILFMASKWNGDTLVEERHCWYYHDSALRAQILAGWAQLAADLATWKPQAAEAKPTGKSPETLPALRIEVKGAVTASNLDEFKAHALEVIRAIKRDPGTDEEFADAEKTVKWCGDTEERLAAALSHARSQMGDIDQLFTAVEDVSAELRRVRLDLDKAVKARKDQMRVEIIAAHQKDLQAHVTGLACRFLAVPPADFASDIKGKRTLASIREACGVVLAEAKIIANQTAERFAANRASLTIEGRDWIDLFPDFATVGSKAPEDFDAVLQLRISRHAEAERLAEAKRQAAQAQAQAVIEQAATVAAPAPAVVRIEPVHTPTQPQANEPATLKLGEICNRLGFTLTAAFLADTLGIQHTATDKSAKLYRESDWGRVCAALVSHIDGLSSHVHKEAA